MSIATAATHFGMRRSKSEVTDLDQTSAHTPRIPSKTPSKFAVKNSVSFAEHLDSPSPSARPPVARETWSYPASEDGRAPSVQSSRAQSANFSVASSGKGDRLVSQIAERLSRSLMARPRELRLASSIVPPNWQLNFGRPNSRSGQGLYSAQLSRVKTRRASASSANRSASIRSCGEAARPLSGGCEDGDTAREGLVGGRRRLTAGESIKRSASAVIKLFSLATTRSGPSQRAAPQPSKRRQWWLQDPQGAPMMAWDAVLVLTIIYTMLVVPFEVSFLTFTGLAEYFRSPIFWVNRAIDAVYAADILLRFVTIYYDKDAQVWIVEPRKIVARYARTWLVPDLVTLIPFDFLLFFGGSSGAAQIIKLLRLGKLLRISKASNVLVRIEESVEINYGLVDLLKYTGILLLITHWLACVLGFLTTLDHETNWATVYFDIAETCAPPQPDGGQEPGQCVSAADLYVAAVYWSAMTVTTIGYGDIVPTNRAEQVVVVIAMLMGGIVFGYIVGVFAGIISSQDFQQQRYREQMRGLNDLIRDACIPPVQAQRLRAFFKFLHDSNASKVSVHRHLLAQMSPLLRGEIIRATDNKWVERLPSFRGAPEAFLAELMQALDHQAYTPGEIVFKFGDDNSRMYVVKKGVVFVGGRILTNGSTFCEESLYKPSLQGWNAVSLTFSFLYTLSREDAHQIVRGYPEIERRFRMMGIRRLFREEACSYAYAVQALFDEDLLKAVEETTGSRFIRDHTDNEEMDIRELVRTATEASVTAKSRTWLKRQLPEKRLHHAAWHGSFLGNAAHIHPLWGHVNAMRVQHYYEKLRAIVRVGEREAEELDKSVVMIQKWVRGWLSRKRARLILLEFRQKQQHQMMLRVPSMLQKLNEKIDRLADRISHAETHGRGLLIHPIPKMPQDIQMPGKSQGAEDQANQ
mmetsp:Transcript_10662/g.25294  ORF Transcript_10662/g.25294 Transcript_10662/m.25294 type:complete len:920 (-) Transcript_10662:679-3438(-)